MLQQQALRGAVASAIEGGELDSRLSESDRVRLQAARGGAARWLRLVDRLPPAELFDIVLRESAYAFELAGTRVDQARENLKKLRALLRRMQNRGYLTLARLVAHLDRLAVGDESNAAIDAADAVSLMTIHAAKGLEFPVVFVVNLSRGTGNRRLPMRVAAAPGGIDASVSNGSVPFGASLISKPRDINSCRKDSRIPDASITMSSSIAAAIATPRTASTVRDRCRVREARARVSLTQRPNSVSGGVRTRRHDAASPAVIPSTSESDTAKATIGGVRIENSSGVW